jgi:hypothetical protein
MRRESCMNWHKWLKKLCYLVLTATLALSSVELLAISESRAQMTGGTDLILWANDGGDKITQDELRAFKNPTAVLNSVWNGSEISLFGGKNEVVSFNLIMEAPQTTLTSLNVAVSTLNGPNGNSISSRPATGNEVFNFAGRNIELFYVRYLKIEGLSVLAYEGYYYDERHIPERFRRPYDLNTGEGSGGWTDRPDHDKYYPEIAVPLELSSPFEIRGGTSQCIWCDIYIPKQTSPGNYTGTVTVSKNGASLREIPITLSVRNFELPDEPSAKTMVFIDLENLGDRYLAEKYPDPGSDLYNKLMNIENLHFQLAHRHKISLIDNPIPPDQMGDAWVSRLDGGLFTSAKGYAGIGEGVGNNVYVIGAYGGWPWEGTGQSEMWSNTNAWIEWFSSKNFATPTDYFLYLVDESEDYPQTEQWAHWIESNPGMGNTLKSFATVDLPDAVDHTPSLDIPCSGAQIGMTDAWSSALNTLRNKPNREFFMYNSQRPVSGTFATEDDGVALRSLAWGQYKLGIDRWFYWDADYYNNYQGYRGETNVFREAQTFGQRSDEPDIERGQNGNNFYNGDGVLFYPGTETRFPQDNYNVMGPLASLRLKEWRRGIQDVDYLTLASKIDATKTTQIVNRMIPKFLWEYNADNTSDPSNDEYYLHSDVSWSTDPDDWEVARKELASIIDGTTYQPPCSKPSTSTPSTPAHSSTPESPIPTMPVEQLPNISLEYIATIVATTAVAAILAAVLILRKRKQLTATPPPSFTNSP